MDNSGEIRPIDSMDDMRRRIGEYQGFNRSDTGDELTGAKQIQRLRKLSELSISVAGDPIEVFNRIAFMISELLNVPIVNMSEIRGDQLVFLSSYIRGELTNYAGSCALVNTPCSTVQETKDLRVYENVTDMFPYSDFLKFYNAHTYCGFPALDPEGGVTAVICLLDDKPHHFSEEDKDLLKILAQRIGLEMERKRHKDERKLADEEKQNLQTQLTHSQKLESIGRLAGGIAHDFNNLLSAVLGYSEMLLMDIPDEGPAREKICAIRDAGERAEKLTRQLLVFSRNQVLEMKVLSLNSIVTELGEMIRRVIGENIVLDITPGAGVSGIKADHGQMEQIVMNLVINARDAMPSGGKLIIETALMELDGQYTRHHEGLTPGQYVMLAVTDTGAGMTPEVREKIFEPFFSTKGHGKGSGLGLATVYGIVKQHKGHIWVYSEPDRGSTFKIYIPACMEETGKPAETQRSSGIRGGTETILVVDDEGFIRQLVEDCLRPLGYNVISASSGKEALKLCGEGSDTVSLLLTDIMMPDMNGRELADQLKEKKPSVKVLFMSGYTENVIAHNGALDPGLAFIQKPLSVIRLASEIRKVLDTPS
jgi:signal transduction histidine kinase/CheY-like chemotaxis protein